MSNSVSLSLQHPSPRYLSASNDYKSPFVCFPNPWLYKYHLIKLSNEARNESEQAAQPQAGSAQPLNERWGPILLPAGDEGDRSSNGAGYLCDVPNGPSSLKAPNSPRALQL